MTTNSRARQAEGGMAVSGLSQSWVTHSHERGKKCCQGCQCFKAQEPEPKLLTHSVLSKSTRESCLVTSSDQKMMPSKALQVVCVCVREIWGGRRKEEENAAREETLWYKEGCSVFYDHISYAHDRHAHCYRIQRSIITGTDKMN